MTETISVPSIGRIVFYKAYGSPGGEFPAGEPRAAIVTEVDDPGNPETPLGLAVFNPSGLWFNRHCKMGDGPGEWSWPPFVPPIHKP